MKYEFIATSNELIDDFERVMKKHTKKLRPSKKATIWSDMDGMEISFEINPINKYSRSLYIYAFEKLIQDIEDEFNALYKQCSVRVSITAGSCDMTVGFSWHKETSLEDLAEAMRESTRKIEAGDIREMMRAKKHLIDAGIITKSGKLTKHYRS